MDDQQFLLRLLVRTDVLFTPFRSQRHPDAAYAAIMERRQDFRRHGLPIEGGGGSDLDRKAHERLLARLEDAGSIVTHRGNAKRSHVRLTDAADATMRALTAGYSLKESWTLLRTLAAWPWQFTQAGCVLETDLIGRDYDKLKSCDLVKLEDRMLVLLVHGLAEAWCDTQGRVGYSITPRGRTAAAGKPPKPPDVACDQALSEQYTASHKAGLGHRATWTTTGATHVVIPLSAGLWPHQRVAK